MQKSVLTLGRREVSISGGEVAMKSLIYLCIGIVGVTVACKDHSVRSDLAQAEQQQQTQVRESEQLKLAQEAAHLQFRAEQNDLEGYDGMGQ
jgi:hypothetical protein